MQVISSISIYYLTILLKALILPTSKYSLMFFKSSVATMIMTSGLISILLSAQY